MKIDGLKIKESVFNDKKIKQLFLVVEGKEYLLGTLKDKSYDDKEILYVNCVHKEFKKNN